MKFFTAKDVAQIFHLQGVTVRSHIACMGLKSTISKHNTATARRARPAHRFCETDLCRYELFLRALDRGEKKEDAAGHLSEFSFDDEQDYYITVWKEDPNGRFKTMGSNPWENGQGYRLMEDEEKYEVLNLRFIKNRVSRLILNAVSSGHVQVQEIKSEKSLN